MEMIKVEVASQIFGRTLSCKYVANVSGDVCEFFTGYEDLSSAIVGEYKAVLKALEVIPNNSKVDIVGRTISALAKGRNYRGRLTELVTTIMDIVEDKSLDVTFSKVYYRKESEVVRALNEVEMRLRSFVEEESQFFKGLPFKSRNGNVAV